ncbi:MAG: flagellar hook-length control protein FliK [Candidatus Marinarcus sp.]|uniref:flagellar hook-length control protein FliK n=1 Tax=Candidatus Marinarcus sp. TaxID=3100987 RepID=UPI003B00C15E
MTKEMSFLTTQAQESKNTTAKQSTTTKEVKSEPSLFDSMLSGLTKPEQEAEASASEVITPTKQDTTKIKTSDKSDTAKKEVTSEKKSKENPTLSLLDRMIIDANSSMENKEEMSSLEEDTPTTTGTTLEPKTSQSEPSLTDDLSTKEPSLKEANSSDVEKDKELPLKVKTDVTKDILIQPKVSEIATEVKPEEVKTNSPVQETKETKTEENKETKTNQKTQDESAQEIPKDKKTAVSVDKSLEQAIMQPKDEIKTVVESASTNQESKNSDQVKTAQVNVSVSKGEKVINETVKQTAEVPVNTQSKESAAVPNKSDSNISVKNETLEVKNNNQVLKNSPDEIQPKESENKKENNLLDAMVKQANKQIENDKTEDAKNKTIPEDVKVKTETSASVMKESVPVLEKGKTSTVPEVTSSKPVNTKVAEELAKIGSQSDTKPLNVSKESLEKLKPETTKTVENKQESKSLLDNLIAQSKVTIKEDEESAEVQKSTNPLAQSTKSSTDPVLTNIYLTSQQKSINESSMLQNSVGKQMALDATSVDDIQKSADFLDLGLDEVEIISKEEEFKNKVKADFLNKLSVSRDMIKQDITKAVDAVVAQNSAVSSTMSKATDDTAVELNISAVNVYNIENRIIGARQQMNSMMSDVARNMYLNYKPPVTAFRMNLNPTHLGSIAVLIKSEKENGLTISLNMSNSATLDSFVDNQSVLRAALVKNFSDETNFSLDFNMQGGEGQSSNNDSSNNSGRGQQNHRSTSEVLERLTSKDEQASKQSSHYM